MYQCLGCGRILSEDGVIRVGQCYEYWGQDEVDYDEVCAYCGGNITDAFVCDVCGEYFQEEDMTTFGYENVCYDCEEELIRERKEYNEND